jgi:hypothetical protein
MKRLFGGLLLGAGILMMSSSGLCSLVIVAQGFAQAMREPSLFIFPVIFGGIPFALGFGLFQWGRWLLRRADDEPARRL